MIKLFKFFLITLLFSATTQGLSKPLSHMYNQETGSVVRHQGRFTATNKEYKTLEVYGPAQVNNVTVHDAFTMHGPLIAHGLRAAKAVIFGPASIEGGQFEEATITGPVSAENFVVTNLNLTGPLDVTGGLIKGYANITGPVCAQSSSFKSLNITSTKVELHNVAIQDGLAITSTRQTPELELIATKLSCKIIFVGKPGIIYLHDSSSIDMNLVVNGQIAS